MWFNELSRLPILFSTVSILVSVVIFLEIVDASLTTALRIGDGACNKSFMVTLTSSSTSSALVWSDGSMSLFPTSGTYLDTTLFASIVTFLVPSIDNLFVVSSTSSSHQESSPEVDVIHSSSSPTTPPLSLSQRYFDCIPITAGDK